MLLRTARETLTGLTSARLEVHRLGLVIYEGGLIAQAAARDAVRGGGPDRLLLLEHTPVYTLGASARPEHLLSAPSELEALGAVVAHSDRGGGVTFHGPGQLVAYPVVDLRRMGLPVIDYVRGLEETMLRALATYGVAAGREARKPGVWLDGAKLGAVGVRVSGGVTSHGCAFNVAPDLAWFSHIVPCGLDARVTSMARELATLPAWMTLPAWSSVSLRPSSATRYLSRGNHAS